MVYRARKYTKVFFFFPIKKKKKKEQNTPLFFGLPFLTKESKISREKGGPRRVRPPSN